PRCGSATSCPPRRRGACPTRSTSTRRSSPRSAPVTSPRRSATSACTSAGRRMRCTGTPTRTSAVSGRGPRWRTPLGRTRTERYGASVSARELIPSPSTRLVFREMDDDDLDDMAGLLGDPAVVRYYPRVRDRAEALEWIRWNRRLYGE